MKFSDFAKYLGDPLVLTGFALFLFFGLANAIIRSGLLKQITAKDSFKVLSRLLLLGFIASILITVLAFGLKFRELSKADQHAAISTVQSELSANNITAVEIAGNLEVILRITKVVSQSVRDDGIQISAEFFPWENINPNSDTPTPLMLARAGLQGAQDKGLLEDKLARQKFAASGQAISLAISNSREKLSSLADFDGTRYVVRRVAWESNLPIVRRVHVEDISKLEQAYTSLSSARSEYNAVLRYAIDYLDNMETFFDPSDNVVNESRLTKALTSEREFFAIATTFSDSLVSKIESSQKVIQSIGKT